MAKSTNVNTRQKKQTVSAIKFECTLVGEDVQHYMMGFMKGTERQVQAAKEKSKNGSKLLLSKPAFDTWTKPAYISTPMQFRINLLSSTMATIDGEVSNVASEPIPPRTIAETVGINTDKTQDVLRFVRSTKNRRPNKDGTVVVDAVLIDGSSKQAMTSDSVAQPVPSQPDASSPDSAQTLPFSQIFVTIWGADNVNNIEANVGRPICLFGLSVKMEGDKRIINLYADGHVVHAPTCEKN